MDLDEESDIAIFQAYLPPNESAAPASIGLPSIESFDEAVPQINGVFIPQYPLWTVGYSGRNKQLKGTQIWAGLQGDPVAQKFVTEWDQQGKGDPMLFDYHLWKYREVLRISKDKDPKTWGPTLSQVSKETMNSSLPVFEDMFHNDQRALAVGQYVSMTSPDSNKLEAFQRKTRTMFHNISSFHQNSGGMLCHFSKGQISSPKVIGMCKKLPLDPFFSR